MVKFRTVVLSCGSVRGVELISNLGKLYVSFKGVPYAKPPVGTLRFKPPQPVEPWTHVRDAIKEGNRAPHFDMVSKEFCGSEDCLYLNIYTPQVPETDEFNYKPVMFWIHGGGFAFGHADSDVYGPDLLVQQDVVLVTVNYRLGVLGFLNLELDGASGNMGLKDQVAALRWVKKEIKAFGGDSNNITIFGNSAGGASVHLHMLSNMSKGLFQKAIAQSGNALCNWAFTTEHKKRAFLLGKLLGFESENPEALLKFFCTITPLEFATHQDSIMTKTHRLKGIDQAFVPSIETFHCDEQVFISEHPKALLQKGQFDEKIPFVTGITSNEGISIIFAIKKFPWFLQELNSKFESFFPSGELYQEKADKIKKLYFSKDVISEESRSIIDFFTDSSFLLPAYESVLLQSRTGQQIFFYEFKHDGKFGWYKRLMSKHRNMKQTEIPQGVCHGDELGYLFSNNILGLQDFSSSSSDIIVAQNITKLWSNFARTGVPEIPDCSASWIPVLDEGFNCLSIAENITNVCPGFKKRIDFWTEIGATTSADY